MTSWHFQLLLSFSEVSTLSKCIFLAAFIVVITIMRFIVFNKVVVAGNVAEDSLFNENAK